MIVRCLLRTKREIHNDSEGRMDSSPFVKLDVGSFQTWGRNDGEGIVISNEKGNP
ncbi:MAG: hypothetical protein BMS9Abin02_0976 [Anaerolineae bacterium]|nr:MAG: hypothetical protein BMS9Abin02_0976 [Anaerolineae bacterium]